MIQKLTLFILSFFDALYQKKWIKFLKKNKLNRFNLLLDIGAHKGESIELFSKNFLIKKIISFEASPVNFELLKRSKKGTKTVPKASLLVFLIKTRRFIFYLNLII